jgi:hypothetical protein
MQVYLAVTANKDFAMAWIDLGTRKVADFRPTYMLISIQQIWGKGASSVGIDGWNMKGLLHEEIEIPRLDNPGSGQSLDQHCMMGIYIRQPNKRGL